MQRKVLICGDGYNVVKENIKALSIEKEIRADERKKVIKEIADLIIPLAKCKKGCKDKYCAHCMMEKLDKIEAELMFLKEQK